MRARPYPAWALLAATLAASAWRLSERSGDVKALSAERVRGWAALARETPEALDRGVAHRYAGLAPEVAAAREVGYFSEKDKSDLWASSSTPAGFDRLRRYYMAQSILAPALLRFDEVRPLVVVDCATPEQADRVVGRAGLAAVRDFGRGLVLARPGP